MKFTLRLIASCTLSCLSVSVFAQNIGIGTNTPTARLHVAAADSAVLMLNNTQGLNSGVENQILFKTGSSFTGAIRVTGTSTQDARLGLFTYSSPNAAALLERLSILDNGNVGINTTSPTNTLDINGTLRIRGGSPGAGKVLTSDANGVASWQAEQVVAFRAAGLIDNATLTLKQFGWIKVNFSQSPQYNYGLGYSGLSGNFVAPYKGIYHFDVRTDLMDMQSEVHMRLLQKRGNSTWEAAFIKNDALSTSGNGVYQFHNMLISSDLLVEPGDTFWIEVYSAGAPNIRLSGDARGNWFSSRLVQPL